MAILARRENLLAEVADAIAAAGAERPAMIVEDLTSEGMAARVQAAVEGHFGHLDILVNNAGGLATDAGLGRGRRVVGGDGAQLHLGAPTGSRLRAGDARAGLRGASST